MHIGILGGTFDPIHRGHVAIARTAMAHLHLNQLTLIPSNTPPHRPAPHATPHQRLAMCQLVDEIIPQTHVSDIELQRTGPSYTIDTLRTLAQPHQRLTLILGADAALLLPQWYQADHLTTYADIAIMTRVGTTIDVDDLIRRLPSLADHIHLIPWPGMDVSSTIIRQRCAANQPIDDLVTPAVATYIAHHGLYRSPA
ncbi:MAG: nicotinate (nicotinamide) nucleotide adenylyltransferase [Chloroflexi bacterium]|nr:nicotinate (nicotinamide) nucleotide adenylyltransferase [Chloroflexota bacterium]